MTSLFLFVLLTPVFSWWEAGHMLVARVAQIQLDETTQARVNSLLQQMPEYDKASTITTASIWADDIKTYGKIIYSLSLTFSRNKEF